MRILKCGYASQQYNFILTRYTNALYVKHFFNFFLLFFELSILRWKKVFVLYFFVVLKFVFY